MVDRVAVRQARADDLHYAGQAEYIEFFNIYFNSAIQKLCKRLSLRQRVIATATVFFKRFYLKNSYCDTEPFTVIAACVYVASKAEESPIHIKSVLSEARLIFGRADYGLKNFLSDQTKLAEMEFYLVDDLECDLTVFHPYRTLLSLCKQRGWDVSYMDVEDGETGLGVAENQGDGQPQYWGNRDDKLELDEGALQGAWFVINDTYRSDLCIIYPPHLIAVAAIYLTLVFHSPTRVSLPSYLQRSSSPSETTPAPPPGKDPIEFLASLNVSIPIVASIAQEILSLYTFWERYREEESTRTSKSPVPSPATTPGSSKRPKAPLGLSAIATTNEDLPQPGNCVTAKFLTGLLMKMRENRFTDMAHPGNGRPAMAVNRILERAKEAG